MHDPARLFRWQVGCALVLLALGIALGIGTANLPAPPAYSQVGPTLFPALIAAGTGLTGLAMLVLALRGRLPSDPLPRVDLPPLVIVGAGLLAHLLLIEWAGFVPASALLYASVTFAFGSRRVLRDVLIGGALAVLAFTGFTYGLGLSLPAGPLSFLL